MATREEQELSELETIYIVALSDWEEFDIKAIYDNEEAAEAHAASSYYPLLAVFDYPVQSTFRIPPAKPEGEQ